MQSDECVARMQCTCSYASVLQSGAAVWCSVVQCDAVWCSVVQCLAVCCSVVHVQQACTPKHAHTHMTHVVNVCYSVSRGCVLQCGAIWCSVVQCGAVWCTVVQCGVVYCSVVQRGAVYCSVMHCVARAASLHANTRAHPYGTCSECVLQCVAWMCVTMCYSALRGCVFQCVAVWCSVVQYVAVLFSVVQCGAVCCNVVQSGAV